MRIILFLAGLLSMAIAAIAVAARGNDIQIGIAATCFIGGMILFGQVSILGGQQAIRRALQDRQALDRAGRLEG